MNAASHSVIDVLSADQQTCFSVPAHLLSLYSTSEPMIACRNYSAAVESGAPREGACRMGSRCKFVHVEVPLSSLRSENIHVHYVWRHESLVTYERLSDSMQRQHPEVDAAATMVQVGAPNNRGTMEAVSATRLLHTRGGRFAFEAAAGLRSSEPDAAPPCHCAHYYFNQMCNRGEACAFLHVVSVGALKHDRVKLPSYHRRLAVLARMERVAARQTTKTPVPSEDDSTAHSSNHPTDSEQHSGDVSPTWYARAVFASVPSLPRPTTYFRHNPYAI